MKTYVWKGPHTSIEVWDDVTGEIIFEGQVSTGVEIPVQLNPDNEQVKGWLAFHLIEVSKAPEKLEAQTEPKRGKRGEGELTHG